MTANKVKIYEGVVCLEVYSPDGGKWWYAGGSLAFTPVLAPEIYHVRYGQIEGTRREVLAVAMKIDGKENLIAVNIPRSDIAALKKRRLWPEGLEEPYTKINYSPWPEHACDAAGRPNKRSISLK